MLKVHRTMKKFKIQSFLQKNLFKKNILNKLLSKFFTFFNVFKSPWKFSLNQFRKKNPKSLTV